jgi:methylmalonyl-CoA epimerase
VSIELDHLGIAVLSIEDALRFYEQMLGMSVERRETVEAEQVHVAMLPTETETGSNRIELLEAIQPDSPIGKFVAKRGPGLHHIALRVDDLEEMAARLKSGGARLLDDPRIGAAGRRYVFVHPSSAGGVLLELIQK